MKMQEAFKQAFDRVARENVNCGECGRRASYEDMLYCEPCDAYVCYAVEEWHKDCYLSHHTHMLGS